MESPFVSCIHKTMASVTECVFGTHPIDSLSHHHHHPTSHTKKTENAPTNRHQSSSSGSISRIVIFFENTLNCFVVVIVVAVGLWLVLVFDVWCVCVWVLFGCCIMPFSHSQLLLDGCFSDKTMLMFLFDCFAPTDQFDANFRSFVYLPLINVHCAHIVHSNRSNANLKATYLWWHFDSCHKYADFRWMNEIFMIKLLRASFNHHDSAPGRINYTYLGFDKQSTE